MSCIVKQVFFVGLMLCWLLGGCLPSARQTPAAGTVSRSSEVIVAECALCHSTKEAQRGPILHGMDEWYLLTQIQKFHVGTRGRNPDNRSEYLMGVVVKQIRDKREMALAAKWFAGQEAMPAIRTILGDLRAGASVYLSRCAVCHGEKAEGKLETASPSLSKLEGWYFIDQMRKFRNGQRGQHGLDPGGQVMAVAISNLTPTQIKDVVAYVVDAFGPPDAPTLRQKFLRRVSESNSSKE
ncbi:MAG: c-type cytochrome [Opitutales bacterium]